MRERKLRWIVIALFIAVALFLILGSLGWVNNGRARSEAATAQSNFYQVVIKLGTADAKGLEAQNPQQTEQIKNGEEKLVKWFVGCVMKATEGRVNPELAEQELKKQLGL